MKTRMILLTAAVVLCGLSSMPSAYAGCIGANLGGACAGWNFESEGDGDWCFGRWQNDQCAGVSIPYGTIPPIP